MLFGTSRTFDLKESDAWISCRVPSDASPFEAFSLHGSE